MASRDRRPPADPKASDHSAVLQVRLPAHRLDQLMLLADRDGTLATSVVTDWVLNHLDQLDPEGDFLTIPAGQSQCGSQLASVTRLPLMSDMREGPSATCQAATASVTSLWAGDRAEDGLRPGSGCR